MTVGDLLAVLADDHITAQDRVVCIGRARIVIGRGPFIVATIDLENGIFTKGIGIRTDSDACARADHQGVDQ